MKLGFKKIRAIVSTLVLTILVIFVYLVALSNLIIAGILEGYLPTPTLFEPHAAGHTQPVDLGAWGLWVRPLCHITSTCTHPCHRLVRLTILMAKT